VSTVLVANVHQQNCIKLNILCSVVLCHKDHKKCNFTLILSVFGAKWVSITRIWNWVINFVVLGIDTRFLLQITSWLCLKSSVRYGRLLVEIFKLFLPPHHLEPSIRVTLLNFWESFTDHETGVFQGANSEDLVILYSIRVCRTDGRFYDSWEALSIMC